MRILVKGLQPEILPLLRLQPAQAHLAHELTLDTGRLLLDAGPAFMAVELAGGAYRPLLAAGLIQSMGPPAIAWCVVGTAGGAAMLALTRQIGGFLAGYGGDVETGVAPGWPPAARWARLLGFAPTGRPVTRWEAQQPLEVWLRCGRRHGSGEVADGV